MSSRDLCVTQQRRRKLDANAAHAQRLDLDGEHRRQVLGDGRPVVAAVGRAVDLAAGSAEVDAAVVERVDGHGVAQDVDVAVLLRQALGQWLPLVASGR